MKGKNILKLNMAIMKDAMDLWLEREFKSPLRCAGVEVVPGGVQFLITVEERETTSFVVRAHGQDLYRELPSLDTDPKSVEG